MTFLLSRASGVRLVYCERRAFYGPRIRPPVQEVTGDALRRMQTAETVARAAAVREVRSGEDERSSLRRDRVPPARKMDASQRATPMLRPSRPRRETRGRREGASVAVVRVKRGGLRAPDPTVRAMHPRSGNAEFCCTARRAVKDCLCSGGLCNRTGITRPWVLAFRIVGSDARRRKWQASRGEVARVAGGSGTRRGLTGFRFASLLACFAFTARWPRHPCRVPRLGRRYAPPLAADKFPPHQEKTGGASRGPRPGTIQ